MRVCSNCNRLYSAAVAKCPEDGGDVAPVTELAEGTLVGQYRIVKPLGEGGMGMVYEAVHEVLGRRAAMKFLRQEWVHRNEVVTRFLQEAQAVNRIDHDGIINVYDYGDGSDGAVYFVMEFLEGEVLLDFQHYNRPIALPLLFHIYRQIMSALAAAHAQDIVHRDLKPANVFLVRRENNSHFVKLLDFGVAKVMGEGERKGLTKAGSVLGTPEFMSPEQIAGRTADARSDIYSLGAMLYDAVVGHVPFQAKGFGALAAQVLTGKMVPPRAAAPDADIPVPLENLILKALSREKELRFQSVAAMLEEFDSIREACGVPASSRAETSQPAPRMASAADPASSAPSSHPAASRAQAPAAQTALAGASAWPKRALIAGLAIAAATVVTVVLVTGGKDKPATDSAQKPAVADAAASTDTIAQSLSAGNLDRARALARADLEALLASDKIESARAASAALSLAATPTIADLLFAELETGPQRKARAARTLARLGLPDAGPKLRAALQASGGRLRLELAAALLELGDRDSVAILERGLEGDPRSQMVAARALARGGLEKKARPALESIASSTPVGRPRWLRASVALARLGDEASTKAVHAELANPDASRSGTAARALAAAGDAKAVVFLERVVKDASYAARGQAALALARLENESALVFVADGLASDSPDDRALAAAVAARLSAASRHGSALVQQATSDSDVRARAVALIALMSL